MHGTAVGEKNYYNWFRH